MDAVEPGVYTSALGEKHDTIPIQETVTDATVDNFITDRSSHLGFRERMQT